MSDETTKPDCDWQDVSIALAASNEKLCRIALAADALANVLTRYMESGASIWHVERALEQYKIVRGGS